MTSIPDSFNVNDLTELLATAKQEDEIHAENDKDKKEYSPEFIMELANETIKEVIEKCPTPTAHKAVMVCILKKMIEWHTNMGEMLFEDGNTKSGICWLRDAGKFQAAWDIIYQIGLGEDDFLCDQD